ncbi:MAG TPA: phosphate ABC transporter permease PstA [Candidatus Onthovicinus excrementipullorum]|nr:phosphate ABC transporter permease PstA [Candidatus Onthovicinus excrementipullorum]
MRNKAASANPAGSLHVRRRRPGDAALRGVIWACAAVTVLILVLILGHILINGLPNISWEFLTSRYSAAKNGSKGILPMIINTLYVVVITLLIAAPVGIGCAVYLTQYARQGRLVRLIRFTTEVLSGIPSIIFGLFGYAFFCIKFQWGYSILAGCFTMAICILPTIVRTTEEALLAVPEGYLEGAMSLGAPKLRVIFTILLPCAMPGILTAVILAMGRIVGETAALLFTVGVSGYRLPDEIFGHVMDQGCTLSLFLYNSAMNGKDPIGIPYATAAVLLILVFLLNRIAGLLARRLRKK